MTQKALFENLTELEIQILQVMQQYSKPIQSPEHLRLLILGEQEWKQKIIAESIDTLLSKSDVRDAIWSLIDKGYVLFTQDRTFILSKKG